MRIQDIDPSFGHWFAGFTDGEGCFTITAKYNLPRRHFPSYGLSFHIGLRRDDLPILEEIRTRINVGRIKVSHQNKEQNPQARLIVTRKRECFRLIDIFDLFPLRAKKARDFSIWKEAGMIWSKIKRLSQHNQRVGRGESLQVDMKRLKEQLENCRTFSLHNDATVSVPEQSLPLFTACPDCRS